MADTPGTPELNSELKQRGEFQIAPAHALTQRVEPDQVFSGHLPSQSKRLGDSSSEQELNPQLSVSIWEATNDAFREGHAPGRTDFSGCPGIDGLAGPVGIPETAYLHKAEGNAERQLAICDAALVSKGIKASSSMEIGNDVVGNIMLVIEREHIDMVVLSTHGISGWRPLVFGSIAEKVVKQVQCPLLLLRSVELAPNCVASTPQS